jgi:arsenical pump membrane protein
MLASLLLAAAQQAWPPFALVVGLLLVGAVVAGEGVFETVGARLARLPLGPYQLLLGLLAVDAVVTAVLNLDTAVVFLTPVLVHVARGRGLDERPFLYGSVFMANAASLLLPGSNLTNLLVLERGPVSGARFGVSMLTAWLLAVAITAAFVAVAFRLEDGPAARPAPPPFRLGLGAMLGVAAAALVLLLRNPAPEVLALGLTAVGVRRLRPRIGVRTLAILFTLTVALGMLAREWSTPARLLAEQGRLATAALAAVASVLVNNLPAAVLLSAHSPVHQRALLLGLDLGPNLAVTGSLSAFLWIRAARSVGAVPSIRAYSRLGAMLVPLTLAGGLAGLRFG